MAKAHEPMTEQDSGEETSEKQPRRRRFGRRKETPREMRTDTEWVDTLVAHEGPDPEPLAGSPFSAGEDEAPDAFDTSALPEHHDAVGTLPDEASEVGDEVVLRERQLYRPDKLSLENRVRAAHHHRGERDTFYEKSWTRRTGESVEDIHNYIDNVLGTELDPSKRRERLGRAGISGSRRREMERIGSVQVEGLDQDLMIAFTFPQDEFRSARVVYETEGGYVVEVTRAVGGDDARQETQYYTVSRIGEVAHVLDKMRAAEAERRAREEGTAPAAPLQQDEPVAPLDAPEPSSEPAPEPPAEPPAPEDVGAPGATTPETPPEASPTEEPEGPTAEPYAGPEAEASEEEPESRKGIGGLFKRKKGDETEAAHEDEPTTPEGPEDAGGKGFGLFKRKKGDDAAEADNEPQADASEPAEPGPSEEGEKKGRFGGLLKRKKGEEEEGPDA